MADRFAHDPVARLEAAKAAHRDSLFTPSGRTTAIEDVLIAQLVDARAERDRYEAALYQIAQRYGSLTSAGHIAREALEGDPT